MCFLVKKKTCRENSHHVDGSSPLLRAPKSPQSRWIYRSVFSVTLYRVVCCYVDGRSAHVNFSEMLATCTPIRVALHSDNSCLDISVIKFQSFCSACFFFLKLLEISLWSLCACSILWDVSSTSKAPDGILGRSN